MNGLFGASNVCHERGERERKREREERGRERERRGGRKERGDKIRSNIVLVLPTGFSSLSIGARGDLRTRSITSQT